MAGKLGSRLAQLASARNQVQLEAELTPEQRAEIESQKAAVYATVLHGILQPHVDEFNEFTEAALHIKLETVAAKIAIKRGLLRLLTVELTSKAVVFKRKGDAYTSDDYFTIHPAPDGGMSFARYSVEVEKPLDANQFAEFLLMEALGLNEPA